MVNGNFLQLNTDKIKNNNNINTFLFKKAPLKNTRGHCTQAITTTNVTIYKIKRIKC